MEGTGIWIPLVVVLVVIGTWMATAMAMMISMKRDCVRLIRMHESPDEFGFGTIALRAAHERDQGILLAALKDNTRAMHEVAHYIKWSIEATTGTKPPPPKPAVMAQGD